jgi:Acyl-CoA dehydrogenase, C-terminal domain
MEGEDLELFERSLRHATEGHTGPALDAALEELGWADALELDPRVAISILFELQGAANASSSALDQVLLHALGPDVAPGSGVVLPTAGRWSPPGKLHGERLTVSGLGTAALSARERAVVVAESGGKQVVAVVGATVLTLRPISGVDPLLGLVQVTGEGTPEELGSGDWLGAVALGQLALGHELVGASRKMLDLARQHALERIQFGTPISTFQAVRHRLAETLVAIETADAMLDAGWLDRSPQTAAMAKALAGRGARVAARHCQQVLAGIGFTTEHSFHRYFRRILVLEQLLGDSGSLTKELGLELLASRQLPPLLPLRDAST